MGEPSIAENALLCADQLKAAGLGDWAKKIVDAVEAGSTGGEIVTAVRFHLQQLLGSKADIPEPTRRLAQKIFRDINATGW